MVDSLFQCLIKKSIREAATANPSIAPYVRNIQDTFLALESKYKDLTLQTDSLPDLQIEGK